MSRIKTKHLKEQFTVRIYNQEDKEILDKSVERNKTGFDNISEFTRYCLVVGAKKLLGDTEVDQTKNLQEISEELEDIKHDILLIKTYQTLNHKENLIELELAQKLANYNANILYCTNYRKDFEYSIENGHIDLEQERLNIMLERDKNEQQR